MQQPPHNVSPQRGYQRMISDFACNVDAVTLRAGSDVCRPGPTVYVHDGVLILIPLVLRVISKAAFYHNDRCSRTASWTVCCRCCAPARRGSSRAAAAASSPTCSGSSSAPRCVRLSLCQPLPNLSMSSPDGPALALRAPGLAPQWHDPTCSAVQARSSTGHELALT